MGTPEEAAYALPPHVTVEIETLRRTVLHLQAQLAAAGTIAECQQVQAAAAGHLRALAP